MNKNTVSASEPKHSILVQLLEDYQNKQFDSAEKSASLITQQFPEHPFAWKLLGALLNQTGRFSEALIACQKSVLLDKNNAEAHNNLGHTLYKLDRLEEAESSYRKSIEIDPKNALAHYNLGQALGKQGNLEQSEISY
jgi:Flp pilus assembly protein TadD